MHDAGHAVHMHAPMHAGHMTVAMHPHARAVHAMHAAAMDAARTGDRMAHAVAAAVAETVMAVAVAETEAMTITQAKTVPTIAVATMPVAAMPADAAFAVVRIGTAVAVIVDALRLADPRLRKGRALVHDVHRPRVPVRRITTARAARRRIAHWRRVGIAVDDRRGIVRDRRRITAAAAVAAGGGGRDRE